MRDLPALVAWFARGGACAALTRSSRGGAATVVPREVLDALEGQVWTRENVDASAQPKSPRSKQARVRFADDVRAHLKTIRAA